MFKPASITFSSLESSRFGYRVYRGNLQKLDDSFIVPFLLSEEVDVAILRLPSICLESIASLNETGIPYIVADTLVYYYCDLSNYEPKKVKNKELSFIVAGNEHAYILDDLVSVIFKNYPNHYSANYLFDHYDILEGYKEWVRFFINSIYNGRIAWIALTNDRVVGFITCTFSNNECEIVLNGVQPESSGLGLYSDFIRFTQKYFKEKGFRDMKVSTQVHNYAVQKVWTREGFYMKKSYNTVHLNSLLNKSIDPLKTFLVKGKLLPGYLEASCIKKTFSKQHPELKNDHNQVTNNLVYLTSIDDDSEYRVIVTIPYESERNKKFYLKALVKAFNSKNDVCVLAYYNFNGEKP